MGFLANVNVSASGRVRPEEIVDPLTRVCGLVQIPENTRVEIGIAEIKQPRQLCTVQSRALIPGNNRLQGIGLLRLVEMEKPLATGDVSIENWAIGPKRILFAHLTRICCGGAWGHVCLLAPGNLAIAIESHNLIVRHHVLIWYRHYARAALIGCGWHDHIA